MVEQFSKQERETLLRSSRSALEKYDKAMERSNTHQPWSDAETEAINEAFLHLRLAEETDIAYFKMLPRLTMSCCPFCGRPLYRTFDPYGLDGLWWRSDATPEEAPACPHFCVVLGAVNFAGHKPEAGDFRVHPGPQVPYVVPRLLELPGMVTVISELRMENGYIAYPAAYFAERRPPPQELTAGWARTNYVYTTQLGKHGWRIPNDPWDFDLLPWLTRGKLRWCPPDSDNSILSLDPPHRCPYVNLPGERQRIVVQEDRVWTIGLPDGEPIWPHYR